jgi:hypothetical protein
VSKRRDDLVTRVRAIIAEYSGMRLTLRQIYYRLVAAQVFPNRISSYKGLSDVLARAREDRQIPWNAIEDRTREMHEGHGEDRTAGEHFRLFWNYVKDMDTRYEMPKWWKQPKRVFCVLEKEALFEVFRQITDAEGVDLIPLRGYSSVTLLHDFANRMRMENGTDLQVLYFGDYDPSGTDIERVCEEKLREYGADFDIIRVAITREQIDEFDIPPAPAKDTDSRTVGFEAEHGEAIQVELDAIEPRALQGIIRDAIRQEWDEDAGAERDEELQRRRDRIRDWLDDAVNPDFETPEGD